MAKDTYVDKYDNLVFSKRKTNKNEFPGLAENLEICIGVKIMLTVNLDISEGLVNSAMGSIVGFKWNNKEIYEIYILFEDCKIGGKYKESDGLYKNCVALRRHTAYDFANYEDYSTKIISRTQFPIKLSFGCTIHKTQSLSLYSVAIDFSGKFMNNMAYVALSRCKTFEGLTLYNFDAKKISTNKKNLYYLENDFKKLKELPIPKTMQFFKKNDKQKAR